jgi:large-conductance mechanosensitive channel
MPSLPQALVDWAQLISAALSFLALAAALFAIWKSNRDIAKERRTTHELEVLRDLSE